MLRALPLVAGGIRQVTPYSTVYIRDSGGGEQGNKLGAALSIFKEGEKGEREREKKGRNHHIFSGRRRRSEVQFHYSLRLGCIITRLPEIWALLPFALLSIHN